MILLLLSKIILLSWPMIALAQAPGLAKSGCRPQCGNVSIPFPFGIDTGCYIDDWFAINCNSRKPFIKRINLEVLGISVENGTIRVNYPVFKSCGIEYSDTVYGNLHEESPFVFSHESNRFTGIGCNSFVLLNSNESIISGCFSICDDKITTGENTCYGINCCQTRIPSSLQVFNATIGELNDEGSGKNHESHDKRECKYAFLVDQDWFAHNVKNPRDLAKMAYVPAVLKWRISDTAFNRFATNKPTTYESTSRCDAANLTFSNASSSSIQFPVVQCHCKRGYEGNPYLLQGCRDTDECNSNNNPCGKLHCENFVGGFGCFSTKKSKIKYMAALGFGLGLGSFLLLIGAWWLFIIIKRRKAIKLKQKFFKQNGGLLLQQQLTSSDGSLDGSKLFNSKELDKATEHFHVNRILGQGGQGTVYKGMLSDGRIIAVKKSKVVDERKIHEFINEVVILSQINHRNVVKLLGCCLETEIPLLVYEFIPNGTLFQYLHHRNEELPLTWDMRLRIGAEVAGALSYLHSAASLPIYHRDIKSTNILLDEKYRAKVADFGTSRSIAIDQTHVTTKVQGTFGYLDPEYYQSSQFTDKSDVYSFGVVLVELLTGRTPIYSTSSEEGKSLVPHFICSMKENSLYNILDIEVLKVGKKEDIMAIANLAKRCLNLNGKKRPTMKEVAKELEGIHASQKDNSVQQTYQEIEYERTEAFEGWDVGSSMTSTFDNIVPSSDVKPLLTNTP